MKITEFEGVVKTQADEIATLKAQNTLLSDKLVDNAARDKFNELSKKEGLQFVSEAASNDAFALAAPKIREILKGSENPDESQLVAAVKQALVGKEYMLGTPKPTPPDLTSQQRGVGEQGLLPIDLDEIAQKFNLPAPPSKSKA